MSALVVHYASIVQLVVSTLTELCRVIEFFIS